MNYEKIEKSVDEANAVLDKLIYRCYMSFSFLNEAVLISKVNSFGVCIELLRSTSIESVLQ